MILSLSFYILEWFCNFNNCIIFQLFILRITFLKRTTSGRNMEEVTVYKNYFNIVYFVRITITLHTYLCIYSINARIMDQVTLKSTLSSVSQY
jgi:hypothetical protein